MHRGLYRWDDLEKFNAINARFVATRHGMRFEVVFHTASSWEANATHAEYLRRKFDTVIKTDFLFTDDDEKVEQARMEMRREEQWRTKWAKIKVPDRVLTIGTLRFAHVPSPSAQDLERDARVAVGQSLKGVDRLRAATKKLMNVKRITGLGCKGSLEITKSCSVDSANSGGSGGSDTGRHELGEEGHATAGVGATGDGGPWAELVGSFFAADSRAAAAFERHKQEYIASKGAPSTWAPLSSRIAQVEHALSQLNTAATTVPTLDAVAGGGGQGLRWQPMFVVEPNGSEMPVLGGTATAAHERRRQEADRSDSSDKRSDHEALEEATAPGLDFREAEAARAASLHDRDQRRMLLASSQHRIESPRGLATRRRGGESKAKGKPKQTLRPKTKGGRYDDSTVASRQKKKRGSAPPASARHVVRQAAWEEDSEGFDDGNSSLGGDGGSDWPSQHSDDVGDSSVPDFSVRVGRGTKSDQFAPARQRLASGLLKGRSGRSARGPTAVTGTHRMSLGGSLHRSGASGVGSERGGVDTGPAMAMAMAMAMTMATSESVAKLQPTSGRQSGTAVGSRSRRPSSAFASSFSMLNKQVRERRRGNGLARERLPAR